MDVLEEAVPPPAMSKTGSDMAAKPALMHGTYMRLPLALYATLMHCGLAELLVQLLAGRSMNELSTRGALFFEVLRLARVLNRTPDGDAVVQQRYAENLLYTLCTLKPVLHLACAGRVRQRCINVSRGHITYDIHLGHDHLPFFFFACLLRENALLSRPCVLYLGCTLTPYHCSAPAVSRPRHLHTSPRLWSAACMRHTSWLTSSYPMSSPVAGGH